MENNTDYMRKIIDLATPKPPAPPKILKESKYEFLKTLTEAYITAEEIYKEFEQAGVVEDRMEYDVEMLMTGNPGLDKLEAVRLYNILQSGHTPTYRPYHIPDEDLNRDKVYPLAAELGRGMQAAGLNLHGPAGQMLDDFGEAEHMFGEENGEIEGYEGTGISMKMLADATLDVAIKTKDTPIDQLPEAIRAVGRQAIEGHATVPAGMTAEQYQLNANDIADMAEHR